MTLAQLRHAPERVCLTAAARCSRDRQQGIGHAVHRRDDNGRTAAVAHASGADNFDEPPDSGWIGD